MTTSLIDAESVLAIDLGSVQTRAILFDVVDGQYRFIASGCAASTVNAPYRDVGESVTHAVKQLQEVTGRVFISPTTSNILLPTQKDGTGVDRLVVTYTAGPELRIIAAGLLPDVSLESAQRLVSTIYGKVVDTISLNDRRRNEAQLDAIISAQPDLIILAGGTERGASRSVFKLVELILLVCRLLPQEKRPQVLYAGNQLLAKKIQEVLEKWTHIIVAPNVRPTIDQEDLGPAQEAFMQVVTGVRMNQIGGLQQLGSVSSTPPIPGSYGMGRIMRFMSQIMDPNRGVLGVDLGSNSTTLAAASAGKMALDVYPYGAGAGATRTLEASSLAEIAAWLPVHVTESTLRDYIYQKSLDPNVLPLTSETLAIEQSLARQALRLSMNQLSGHWQNAPYFEPIFASGSILTQAPTPAQALLMLLDGLQPMGITTVLLDQNGLLPLLGAIAKMNSVLPVQVIESGAFMNLGTVISPVSDARYGTPILRVRLVHEDGGGESNLEVRQGNLLVLPIPFGQKAKLQLQTLHRTEIEPRVRRNPGGFTIVGGVCGAVIDARGRPLGLPKDDARRREMIKKWALTLGG